jgi:hypothetical protein
VLDLLLPVKPPGFFQLLDRGLCRRTRGWSFNTNRNPTQAQNFELWLALPRGSAAPAVARGPRKDPVSPACTETVRLRLSPKRKANPRLNRNSHPPNATPAEFAANQAVDRPVVAAVAGRRRRQAAAAEADRRGVKGRQPHRRTGVGVRKHHVCPPSTLFCPYPYKHWIRHFLYSICSCYPIFI